MNNDFDTNCSPNLQQDASAALLEPPVCEKKVRRTTAILIAAAAVVLGGIFLANKKSSPAASFAASAAGDKTLEAALAKLTGINRQSIGQVDELVKKFYEFSDFAQVASSQLAKDPFAAYQGFGSLQGTLPEKSSAQEQPQMQLSTIMQSKYGNCCMIDDMLLYKGDKINGFEVVQIESNFVELFGDGQKVILPLQKE